MEEHATGSVGIHVNDARTGARVRFGCAYEIVAMAIVKRWPKDQQTIEEFLRQAFTFLKDASAHAVTAVRIATWTNVWERIR